MTRWSTCRPGVWADLLTGREYAGDAPAHELLADLPVALLIRERG